MKKAVYDVFSEIVRGFGERRRQELLKAQV